MVVYYVPEQALFGMGTQQGVVAQGEPVREGQKLMRIPDLNQMMVNVKVQEAMVRRVRGEKWKSTGLSDGILASQLFQQNPVLSLACFNAFQEMRPAFMEANKTLELFKDREGQPARVRVDAYHDKFLKGHVKYVATVASQADRMSTDVKVYQTMVVIDENLEGLKPGMTAQVTIFTDDQTEHVLAIPVQAIVGGPEMGSKRKCYVQGLRGVEEREIVVGLSNERMAEVKEGLSVGEEVVLNPRTLENEKKKGQGQQGSEKEGGKEGKGKGKDLSGEGGGKGGGSRKGNWQQQ
jgi:multidrug efflux pump subunit AcrA (membrane-fusion protein)